MPASRKRLAGAVSLAVIASGLLLAPAAPAQASATPYTNLMISEVYGGDGSANASYHHDYVELFNPTAQPVTIAASSLYISYFSAVSSTSTPVAIPAATIPAYTHFMIERSAAGGGATPVNQNVPHADATIALPDIAGAGGRVYLQDQSTAITDTGDLTPNTHILDAVTSNAATGTYEGARSTATGTATLSLQRKSDATHGYQDTNNAANDLTAATPTPKSLSDGALPLGGPTPLSMSAISNIKTFTNKAVSAQAQATGGTGTKTYDLTGDPSTGGLTINQAGLISGTPTDAGVYHLTATVTAGSETATRTFDLTAVAPNHADHVLVSEVWGDGGYTDAPFTNDYIELYNPTANPVDLTGYAIAYGAYNRAAGSQVPTYPLTITGSDTIPAGGYYLILGQSDANGGGVALPDADATVDIDYNYFDYRDGFVALLDTTTAPTLPRGDINSVASAQHIVDAVGYGPANTFEGTAQTAPTSSEIAAIRQPVDNDSNDSNFDWTLGDLTPTNSAGVVGDDGTIVLPTTCDSGLPANPTISVATLQGTNAPFSPYINCNVTTTGVVTAVYNRGFSTAGAVTCGACGFYIQTPGADATPNASDAVFVSVSSFTGINVAIGDAVRVTGKANEFGSGETLTQITATSGNISVTTPGAGGVVMQGSAPTTYAAREAHEGELFQPTDVVVTDTYNFESQGELGLAAGAPTGPAAEALGDVAEAPLQQPGQVCRDGNSTCIQAAQADVKNRGYFLTGGTTYLGSSNIYTPNKSRNSDIPYPFIDKTHSARVGAKVSFPQGAVLDFRNKKWFLNPPRSVVASDCTTAGTPLTHTGCTIDRGEDVVQFEDTRADNATPRPAPADSNIRFATYNVENFFSVPMEEFASANPWYSCTYNKDRAGNGIQSNDCTNPTGMPTAWDPVTGAVTAYGSALASAPRGAGRQEDLGRQTQKIVTAINLLGADVVALEEIGNPNKLKRGVTNSPLNPDISNTKDQGQGTAMQWRDETVNYLVQHLNEGLPADQQWAFAASPEESTDSTSVPGLCATVQPNGTAVPGPANLRGTCSYASGQDVIRSAFIYKKTKVIPVGTGDLDLPGYTVNGVPDQWGNHVFAPDASPFDNAREPLAQYFKPIGAKNDEGFALIVNHFKSKGDAAAPAGPAKGGDKNDPLHGAFNASRVAQAREVMRFANAFAAKWHTDKVFMLGDFNAYSGEDPIHAITDASDTEDPLDFKEIHSDDPNDTSYVFTTKVNGIGYGGAGSLDHILASAGARATDPRTDIWEINANEADVYDYGRYNTNATDFFDGSTPWRGSDHNPEVIDLNLPSAAAARKVTDVQILGINDFHGRLIADSADGGAAPLAGAVNSLRGIYGADQTVLASAGDNVGASIFESFTQEDKPTLDALNAMNLQVSSVGNHEFDRGVNDLLNRIEQPKSDTNPYGADDPLSWGSYLAANVVWKDSTDGHTAGQPISDPTKMIEVPNSLNPGDPIKIGFVGTVTSDLPSLQSPANLEGVSVLDNADTIDAVNDYAADLKADGANLVVLLTHEGAATTACNTMETAGTAFSTILNGVDDNVDAILSGHTHLEYSCSFTKGATASNPLTARPVLQGASYGTALDQLVYSFDADNIPVDLIANNVGVKGPNGALFNYGPDADVQPIVDQAVADSAVAGAQVLGKMTDQMYRSKLSDGTDNRGGESVLGNQVAEIQRWATQGAQQGGAQIAFMNPGGLRADALGTPNGDIYDLTYREAADVQPFANELVNMKLTGAQIQQVLEEQWQRDAFGNIPARPFLKLGISKGFSYTYTEKQDPAKPTGAMLGTVTGMWLDGEPIDPDATYSVTVNSFLATGGDNFWELNNGTNKLDTEQTDLQGQVDYMKQYATEPLEVDSSQRGVRVTFPNGAPSSYAPGETVAFDLASLDMNAPGAVQDDTLTVMVGDQAVVDDVPVTHGNGVNPDDHWGTASVSFVLPGNLPGGQLHVVGNTTGTDVLLPATAQDGRPATAVSADDVEGTYGQTTDLAISVAPSEATGTVTVKNGSTTLGSVTLTAGAATYTIGATALEPGEHTLTLRYGGDADHAPSASTVTVTVDKAASTVAASASPATVAQGETSTVTFSVSADDVTPTGPVVCSAAGMDDVEATLDGEGSGTCEVGPWSTAGDRTITVSYGGDDHVAAGDGTTTVTVSKSIPTVSAVADPTSVVQDAGTSQVTVTLSSTGTNMPTGTVTCDDGSPTDVTVTNGQAVCVVGPFGSTGTSTVTLGYSGDDNTAAGSTTVAITVTAPSGGGGTPTPVDTTVTGSADPIVWGNAGTVSVTVKSTKDTTGNVVLRDGSTTIGTASVAADGTADVVIPARSLAVGSHTLTIAYAGDAANKASSGTVTVTVNKASSTTTADTSPNRVVVESGTATIQVTVASDGSAPTGTVTAMLNGNEIGSAPVSGGQATITVGPFGSTGVKTIQLRYSGSDQVAESSTTTDVRVVKAEPSLDVKIKPGKIKVGKTKATVTVKVTADGFKPTGFITIKAQGQDQIRVRLDNGKAEVKLDKFGKTGEKSVKVSYEGDDKTESSSTTEQIKVVKKK